MNEWNDYRRELDALRFTEQQKKTIADRAAKAAGQGKRRRGLWRPALLAAALCGVLAVTAGATGVLQTAAEAFSGLFGGSVAQTEVIEMIGRPIGAGDTANGVTITADAVMGDAYNAAVVYTIRRDDGTRLLPEGTNGKGLLMSGFGGASLRQMGGAHGSSYIVDDDPEDDRLRLVQTISAEKPIPGTVADVSFGDLCAWDDEAEQSVPVVEGSWHFRFRMDYEDASLVLGGGETFTRDGLTFTIDEVRVSPTAVRVAYTADQEVRWSDAPSGRENEADSRQMQRYLGNVELLLIKTDGTVVDMTGSGGSVVPGKGVTVCTKGGVLEEVLPLEDLAGVSVGGVVYPMN